MEQPGILSRDEPQASKGQEHIANATDPRIPAALAPVVVGVASLRDFMPKSLMMKPKPAFSFPCTGCPDGFDNTEQFDVAPPDFATIYNVLTLPLISESSLPRKICWTPAVHRPS
jgi:hypothetical protein